MELEEHKCVYFDMVLHQTGREGERKNESKNTDKFREKEEKLNGIEPSSVCIILNGHFTQRIKSCGSKTKTPMCM